MTTTKQTTVWCDRTECRALIQLDEGRLTEARKQARHEGWAHIGADDYCPVHASQETK